MVSNASIICIIISGLLSFLFPILLLVYLNKKYKLSFKAVGVGALIFFVSVLILESLMHQYFLIINKSTAKILKNTWIYAIYGAFAAGIFEEVGRFIGYKFMLKGKTERKDGLAYGIGHGGLEAVILGGVAAIQNLSYSMLINSATLKSSLGTKVSDSAITQIKNSLINTSSYSFLLGGFERVFALSIQIFLSLVVLYGIKEKKYIYLLYAILIHAAIDFPAVLFQRGVLTNMWIIEGMYGIIATVCLFLTIKSKNGAILMTSDKTHNI